MNLADGKISKRQWFRMSYLECVTISMMMIPYITLSLAGKYHVLALVVGLAFVVLYGALMLYLADFVPCGYINAIRNHMGWTAGILGVLYALRYLLRATLIAVFFSMILQRYLLQSFSVWWIFLPFLGITLYGASKSMEGRGRMFEFLRIKEHLESGKLAISFETDDEDEIKWIKEYNLLTGKPVIYAANVSEDDLADDGASNPYVQKVREYAKEFGSEVFAVCAQIEQEISELDDDEKQMFLEELGVSESGLDKLIKASYSLLGLISYLTSGPDETRAWTITKGTKAPQAAGKIHTDFERGFIKAEVVAYDDLMESGNMLAAKEKGLVRQEGKEYVVQDGDVILFKFNV